jgi:hypothetical protein
MNDEYSDRSPPDAKQPTWPPASPAPTNAPSLTMIIFVALVLCIPGNVLVVPAGVEASPPIPVMLLILVVVGTMGAQVALLTVLLVWGAGPFWLRFLCHWGLALVLLLAWCAGWLWAFGERLNWSSGYTLQEAKMSAGGLMLFSLLMQVVPWLLSMYLGWRIRLSGPGSKSVLERLSIRDLLAATVLVAIAVTAARVGRPEYTTPVEYWLGWLGLGIGVVIFVIAAIIPMVYFTLGMRNERWGIGGVLTLSIIPASCLTVLLIATRPSGGPPVWQIPLGMTALVGGYSGVLAGTLWIARAYGYRLVTRRTDSQSVQATQSIG